MRVKRQLEIILKIKADSFAKQDLAIFSAEVYKTFATVNSTAMVKPAAIIENDVSHIQPTKEAING